MDVINVIFVTDEILIYLKQFRFQSHFFQFSFKNKPNNIYSIKDTALTLMQ